VTSGVLVHGGPAVPSLRPRSDALCSADPYAATPFPRHPGRSATRPNVYRRHAGTDMRGANGEHGTALNRAELLRTASTCSQQKPPTCVPSHSCRSVGRSVRVHTEEVTGSIP